MSSFRSSELAKGAPCVFKACRGTFHAGTSSLGVVLCAPWGSEELRARDDWRLLAEAVAEAGYPCLRFDYPGTGESAGAMTDIENVAEWTGSIASAADFLRAYSGVKTFVFVGQGLGAALAMQAAGLRSDVVGILLMAPVASGRAYVDEVVKAKHTGGGIAVSGFSLGARLVKSLQAMDSTKSALGAVAKAIVFDQTDRKAGAEVSEFYKRCGIAARLMAVQNNRNKQGIVIRPLAATPAQIIEALGEIKPGTPSRTPRVPLLPATLRASAYREEPLPGGDGSVGTLCHPLHATVERPVFVFLSEGQASPIGWGRGAVDQARALAAEGFSSLRLAPRSAEEVFAAIDALAARGLKRILVVGLGEAATMALTVGQSDPRVTDIIAVNPPRLVGDQTEKAGSQEPPDALFARLYALLVPPGLRKRVEPWLQAIHAFAAPKTASLPSSQGSPLRVQALFTSLSDRGARMSLVYSDTDPGLRALRLAYGPLGRDLILPGTSVSIMPRADHRVTDVQAAAMLRAHLIGLGHEAMDLEMECRAAA